MIVISGALVLVALVLLLLGIVSSGLTFVYASIVISLVSLVFLIIGILQRRGEILPGDAVVPADTSTSVAQDVTAAVPVGVRTYAGTSTAPVAAVPVVPETVADDIADDIADDEDDEDDELEYGGTVLVVAGRPRYHVEGCRYLIGKQVEPIDVLDALEEGFTPCGVCKPDAALDADNAAAAAAELEPEPVPAMAASTRTIPTGQKVALEKLAPEKAAPEKAAPAKVAAVKVAPAKVAPVKTAPVKVAPVKVAPVKVAPVKVAPVKVAPVKVAPVKVAPVKVAAVKTAPVKVAPVKVAPVKVAPVKLAAAKVAPAAAPVASRVGLVVVIPDRGRFHLADCRYVRGVDGTELMNKASATRQGYAPCGVCKP